MKILKIFEKMFPCLEKKDCVLANKKCPICKKELYYTKPFDTAFNGWKKRILCFDCHFEETVSVWNGELND